jgi:multidrug efflux pump
MELLPLVQAKLEEIGGLQIFGFNLPSLPGTGEGLPFQFVINTAGDYPALLEVAQRIKARGGRQVRLPRYRPGLRQARGGGRHRPRQGGADGRVDGHLGGTLATLLGEAEINRFTSKAAATR